MRLIQEKLLLFIFLWKTDQLNPDGIFILAVPLNYHVKFCVSLSLFLSSSRWALALQRAGTLPLSVLIPYSFLWLSFFSLRAKRDMNDKALSRPFVQERRKQNSCKILFTSKCMCIVRTSLSPLFQFIKREYKKVMLFHYWAASIV